MIKTRALLHDVIIVKIMRQNMKKISFLMLENFIKRLFYI